MLPNEGDDLFMRLSELQTGQKAYIVKVNGSGAFRKRILEMGFVRGEEVKSVLNAPLKDPIKYEIMEYEVSLRRSEAVMVKISMLADDTQRNSLYTDEQLTADDAALSVAPPCNGNGAGRRRRHRAGNHHPSEKNIKVALLGNPNSGKTSIFNLASGAHERVGNYSGVTVNAKEGMLSYFV